MNYPDAIAEIKRQLSHRKIIAFVSKSQTSISLVQALEAIISTDEAMRKNCERIQALKDKGAGGWIDLVASNCCEPDSTPPKK